MAARKKNNDIYLWGGIIAIGFYFITSHEWANLTVYLPIVFFFLAWFFLLAMPTRCRFPGRKGPCRNRSYGTIFGCRQVHWLMKARAKLGIGRQETPPSPARGRRQGTGGAGFETYSRRNETIPDKVEETRKDRIIRRLGLLSTCCGVVTSIGHIVNWVEAAAKWIISMFD
ncbi:MAG: hypothetical protein ACRDQ4_16835 [Pseudonocardiaceae bacterium]